MSWHKLQLTYQQFKKNEKSLTNTRIDKYIISQKIGSGSYGSVYKGINEQNQKVVAIKVLDLSAIQKQETCEKVRNIRKRLAKTQSELMMKIDSEHVMKLFDVYESRHLKIMVVQYCNEGTIAQQMLEASMKGERMSQKKAIEIVKQIILGLSAMHKCNIIHRDLKTENIMSNNGIYKIVDLGFAKMIPPDSSDHVGTILGTVLGTIVTMAPEVIRRERYGLKADIWSIGVILYEMIYGKLPYQPMKSIEMYEQIISKTIFPYDGKINGIRPSQEVLTLLKRLLQKDQRKRIGWQQLLQQKLFESQHQIQDTYHYTAQINKIKMLAQNQPKQRADHELLQTLSTSQSFFKQDTKIVQIFSLNKNEIEQQKQYFDQTQKKVLQWAITNHLQCLKTELILRKIILPIEKENILNLKSRKVIQLMYLLSSRCFFNMSFILNSFIDTQNPIVKDLIKKSQKLYSQVKQKLSKYSTSLTDQQNKIISITMDRFSKIFNQKQFSNKDKFLTGIQNSQFTKQEQIEYTNNKYISYFIHTNIISHKSVYHTLKNYHAINSINLHDLKQIKFFDKVRLICQDKQNQN